MLSRRCASSRTSWPSRRKRCQSSTPSQSQATTCRRARMRTKPFAHSCMLCTQALAACACLRKQADAHDNAQLRDLSALTESSVCLLYRPFARTAIDHNAFVAVSTLLSAEFAPSRCALYLPTPSSN
eukprot:3842077-Pleurochrysis_carterae.AAC.2